MNDRRIRSDQNGTPPARLLLYSGSFNHIVDGVTLTLNRLVSYLEERGTDVLVVSPTSSNPEFGPAGRHRAIPSIPLPGRGEYLIGTMISPKVRREITRFRPDVIHVATPDLPGRWTMSYARRHAIPVLSTYHTDFSSYLSYYHLERLEPMLLSYLRYFYRRPELVCVPSRSMIEELSRRGVEGRMRVWERGVEEQVFSPEKRSEAWREGIGADDETVVINYTGRLVSEKNVMMLPQVAERLVQEGVPHRIVIVGEGPARQGLQEAMPTAIFTGHLSENALAESYASSDIFLFPSQTETFGNVILEAMASGLPTLCADATGSRDLVVHGRTGLLADASNPELFSEGALRMATDQEYRKRLGQAAYRASHAYRWDAILGKMVGYYNEATRLVPERPGLRRLMGVAG